MSGHSKWSTIKHKKEANDAKKGKIFSKVSALITHSAKQGGGDPEMNPTLRMHIDKAKSVGFPIDKIERAIAKGTGEGGDGITFSEVSYEGYGPCNIAIIVDCLTDNTNRTISEIRRLFEDIGGSIGESGSISWNFDTKGSIVVKCGHMVKSEKYGEDDKYVEDDLDTVMMELMDIDGVMDITETDVDGIKALEVITEFQDMAKVRDSISSSLPYVIDDASIIKVPKMSKRLEGNDLEKVLNALDKMEDNDDVQNIWSDLDY